MPLSTTVLSRPVLTVRVHAGLNAASLLAGLFTVGGIGLFSSADELLKLHFPKAQASLEVEPVSVNGIGGVTARTAARLASSLFTRTEIRISEVAII